MLLMVYLVPEAFVNTQGLGAEAVADPQVVHEVGQVDGPHALRQLQLAAGHLEVLVADRMEVPGGGHRVVRWRVRVALPTFI